MAGAYAADGSYNVTVVGGGGGSSAGSVTPAGTSGTQAQAVQGITGGVPQNVTNSATVPDSFVPAASPYSITNTGNGLGIDTTGYGSVVVNFTTVASGCAATGQVYDGVSAWVTIPAIAEATAGAAPDSTAFAPGNGSIYRFNTAGKLFRIQVFNGTGTTTYNVTLRTSPVSARTVFANLGTAGVYNTTLPILANGALSPFQLTQDSKLLVSVAGGTINPTAASAGTNRSATIGTTAVTLMALNTARRGWKIKNDTTGDIWINFDTTATAVAGGGNIKVPANSYLASEPSFVETGAMSAIGSAAGLAITAREH